MTQFRPGSFQILPLVVKNLLIINVLFFLAKLAAEAKGIDIDAALALHHVRSPLFQPWQLITYMFLHGDWRHIFFNMIGLWMFGAVLEDLWGPKRFLTFYLLCGVGAGLVQLGSLWFEHRELVNEFLTLKAHATPEGMVAFFKQFGLERFKGSSEILQNYVADPDNIMGRQMAMEFISQFTNLVLNNSTVGASGAIFGILAAFIYLYPNSTIYLYFLFPIKAKYIGLVTVGYELYSAFRNEAGDNIAHWAHIGGAVVGFLLVLTWNKTNRKNFY